MIVIFEGACVTGKTTIIEKLTTLLESWELPVQKWKDERGADPIADMNIVLDEGIFTDNTIWLLDRFHMSEWTITKATRRAAYPGSEWAFYEANLQQVDERLAKMKALIVFVASSPWLMDQRRSKTNKKDPIGESQQALFWWNNTRYKTVCDNIHVLNDHTSRLDQLVRMIADFIYIRWQRMQPKPAAVEAAEELGAKVVEVDYEALEKEHLGDAEKQTGIYAPKEEEPEVVKVEVKEEEPKDDIPF